MFRLGEEPGDDLSAATSAKDRLEMVWLLTARMWALTGRQLPTYTRPTIPIRVIRRP